ncbi:MAG: universal stress protein [Rhodospirillaceae bacterium]|nr:universal stress protein [Rhodospirillaceae bacterium]
MSTKDILVHLDTGAACGERIEVALRLAAKFEARIIGLFVRSLPYVPHFVAAQIGPDIYETQKRVAEREEMSVRKDFLDRCAAAGQSGEWRCDEGDMIETVCLHGKYVDLVVIGQFNPDEDHREGEMAMADNVVMDAGRPVLVVPYAGTFPTIGERVMVAWNASRESVRSIHDALPFLKTAKSVEVVAANPQDTEGLHGDIPCAAICTHLSRHGVTAVAKTIYAEDMNVGALILSRVADDSIDLLVTGAYGRSRLRELILGGVTRHLLGHMTVPVLMSH